MVQVLVRCILTYRGVRDKALRPALMVKTPPHGRTGLQKERSSSSLLLMEARISSNSVLHLVKTRHLAKTKTKNEWHKRRLECVQLLEVGKSNQ